MNNRNINNDEFLKNEIQMEIENSLGSINFYKENKLEVGGFVKGSVDKNEKKFFIDKFKVKLFEYDNSQVFGTANISPTASSVVFNYSTFKISSEPIIESNGKIHIYLTPVSLSTNPEFEEKYISARKVILYTRRISMEMNIDIKILLKYLIHPIVDMLVGEFKNVEEYIRNLIDDPKNFLSFFKKIAEYDPEKRNPDQLFLKFKNIIKESIKITPLISKTKIRMECKSLDAIDIIKRVFIGVLNFYRNRDNFFTEFYYNPENPDGHIEITAEASPFYTLKIIGITREGLRLITEKVIEKIIENCERENKNLSEGSKIIVEFL